MKIYKLSIALVLCFIMASCDKEDTFDDIDEGTSKTAQTAKTENLMSAKVESESEDVEFPEGYWEELSQFTVSTMNEEAIEMMEINKSLYYSESALTWRLTGHEDLITENIGSEMLTFELNSFEEEGQVFVSGDAISEFNSTVYNSIADVASSFEGDIIVKTIDLNWSVNNSNNTIVNASVKFAQITPYSPCATNFVDAQADVNVSCKNNIPRPSGIRQVDGYLSGFNNCFYWPIQQCGTNTNPLQYVNIRTVSVQLPIMGPNGPVYTHVTVTGPGACYVAPTDHLSKINEIRNIYNDPANNISSKVLLAVGADIVRETGIWSHRGVTWARYTIADCAYSSNPNLPVISKPTF